MEHNDFLEVETELAYIPMTFLLHMLTRATIRKSEIVSSIF